MTGFCRTLSIAGGEPLAGSAAEVRVWIVLEYRDAWEPKPLAPSRLPADVKERIEAWLEAVPGSRHQFVRRPDTPPGEPLSLFVARSDGETPWTLRFALSSYRELLDLDLAEVVRAGSHPAAEAVRDPLYLVCCHGKRDRCCATWGVALFHRVREAAPGRTWQTTHLGGHRFAATMAVLPHGVCYGRLEADEGRAVVAAHERGETHDVERMRGRSAFDPVVQLAEVEVRRRTGERSVHAPRVDGVDALDDDRWLVRLEAPDGAVHEVVVARERLPGLRPKSCGDEPSPIEGLRVVR